MTAMAAVPPATREPTLISRLPYCAHELVHQQGLSEDAATAPITELILDGIRPQQSDPR